MWQEPVIDWSAKDNFTHEDWNRICGNINYLYPDANLKTTYTKNDVLTKSAWNDAITILEKLVIVTGVNSSLPDEIMTASNINKIEGLILELKKPMDLRFAQRVANIYSGDSIYVSTGPEDYTRGI